MDKEKIRKTILKLVQERGLEKSICPSEAAKAMDPREEYWRSYLKDIRRVAVDMAQEGDIHITRKGKIQDPYGEIKGVLRLKLASKETD